MGFVGLTGMIAMKPKTRRIDQNGRISLPSDFLREVGFNPGDEVFIKAYNGILIISDVYLSEWGESDRKEILNTISNVEKKIISKSTPEKIMKPIKRFERSDKYNPKWAYEMKEKGYSVAHMCNIVEKDIGIRPNRSTLTRWIIDYRRENKEKD